MTDLTKLDSANDSSGSVTTPFNRKLIDMGDGTHAEVVSSTPTAGAVFTVGGVTANPAGSALTAVGGATAYTALDLIASNATAGSIVVPSMTVMRVAAGSGFLNKIRLFSNATTGLASAGVALRLWSVAPTYTNGDNGAYAVATGAAGFLGKYTGTFEQFADGAVADLIDASGGPGDALKLAAGQVVYWDLQATTGFTLAAGKTFTPVPQVFQD